MALNKKGSKPNYDESIYCDACGENVAIESDAQGNWCQYCLNVEEDIVSIPGKQIRPKKNDDFKPLKSKNHKTSKRRDKYSGY